MRDFKNNRNELVRTPASDEACRAYVELATPLFPYCRFSDAGVRETWAVIGDSHAHVAFPGIAEALQRRERNTLLLANSSCPPLMGLPTGRTPAETEACRRRIDQMIGILLARPEITSVFLFTRGPIYVTGTEPVTGARDVIGPGKITYQAYAAGLQRTVEALTGAGKRVYYVAENPELQWSAEACMPRPFHLTARDCRPERGTVAARQKAYRDALAVLPPGVLIDSFDLFCPDDRCIVSDGGFLLYADANHLSLHGSRFLSGRLLSPYLDVPNR